MDIHRPPFYTRVINLNKERKMKAVTFFNRSAVAAALLATGLAVQLPRTASAQDYTIVYGQGQTTYSFVNVGIAPATVVAQYYPQIGRASCRERV